MKNPKKQENLKPFKIGEDSRRNLKGRPKKRYTVHIEDLQAMGYAAPTKEEYFDLIGLLMAMEENDLKEFGQDETRPYWIRLIVQDLENKNSRLKIMQDFRDWMFGRASQKTEIVAMVAEQKPKLDVSKLSTELLLLLNEAYEEQGLEESNGDP